MHQDQTAKPYSPTVGVSVSIVPLLSFVAERRLCVAGARNSSFTCDTKGLLGSDGVNERIDGEWKEMFFQVLDKFQEAEDPPSPQSSWPPPPPPSTSPPQREDPRRRFWRFSRRGKKKQQEERQPLMVSTLGS